MSRRTERLIRRQKLMLMEAALIIAAYQRQIDEYSHFMRNVPGSSDILHRIQRVVYPELTADKKS